MWGSIVYIRLLQSARRGRLLGSHRNGQQCCTCFKNIYTLSAYIRSASHCGCYRKGNETRVGVASLLFPPLPALALHPSALKQRVVWSVIFFKSTGSLSVACKRTGSLSVTCKRTGSLSVTCKRLTFCATQILVSNRPFLY